MTQWHQWTSQTAQSITFICIKRPYWLLLSSSHAATDGFWMRCMFLYSLNSPWLWASTMLTHHLCVLSTVNTKRTAGLKYVCRRQTRQLSQTYWLLVIHILTTTVPSIQYVPYGLHKHWTCCESRHVWVLWEQRHYRGSEAGKHAGFYRYLVFQFSKSAVCCQRGPE